MIPEHLRVFLMLAIVAALFSVVLGRKDFACSADEVECTRSETCTRLAWKCDGEHDCMDGEDELGCPPVTCPSGRYKCNNGRCIDQSWVCDRHADCPGKDDEAPIQKCNRTTCGATDFQCRNGDCIQGSYRCDRDDDCDDKSDEQGCPELVCETMEFKCSNNLTCISYNLKCNGVNDCADQSDEQDCPSTCDPNSEFTCANGDCHPISFQCDDDRDCLDGSDELACPTRPPVPPCPDGKFQCYDGECIPLTWQCDGTDDCNSGADELGCPPTCSSTQFTCVRSGACISQQSKCDHVVDCSDGSDEAECGLPTLCSDDDSFHCGSSSYCINKTKVCNGHRDCPRGEDEAPNCGIDECSDHNGHCIQNCRDLAIGYECYCDNGYKLASDNRSCEDLNECEEVYGSCSQTCENFKGIFRCGCVEGYRQEIAGPSDTCRATGPQAYVVFASQHSIRNLTASGTQYGVIASNLHAPIAVGHDIDEGYVYWTDILDGKIERTRLRGDGNVETLVDKVVHSNGLVIDWIGKKIYWTDETLQSIEVSELDGTNRLTLFSIRVDVPRGIALDPFERYMFWTDWSEVHPKIERASMDGDSASRQVILDTGLTWPTALTMDTITQRLFFLDTKSQRIETIKYDGTGRKTLVSKGLVHPLGLVVFEDRLYYTDYSLNKIFIVCKRTGQRLGELRGNLERPSGINIVHPLHQKLVPTQCNQHNGGCSHLCLLSRTSLKNYTCRCPNGMLLRGDGKSCAHIIEPNSTTPQPPVRTTNSSSKTGEPGSRKTKPSGQPGTTDDKVYPLPKKQEGSSNSGPMIAGVTVSVGVLIFGLIAAVLCWRRRAKMADRSILFYKDTSRTPLQNDFDDDPIKTQDEIGGMSRVQFT